MKENTVGKLVGERGLVTRKHPLYLLFLSFILSFFLSFSTGLNKENCREARRGREKGNVSSLIFGGTSLNWLKLSFIKSANTPFDESSLINEITDNRELYLDQPSRIFNLIIGKILPLLSFFLSSPAEASMAVKNRADIFIRNLGNFLSRIDLESEKFEDRTVYSFVGPGSTTGFNS